MSTSSLIQYLNPTSTSATGTTVDNTDVSNRREVETFIASDDITSGDWCMFDLTQNGSSKVLYVKRAIKVGGWSEESCQTVVGCALVSARSGETIDLVVSGYHPAALTDAAGMQTVQRSNQSLFVNTSSPGVANAAFGSTAGTQLVGVTLATPDFFTGLCEVFVYKNF